MACLYLARGLLLGSNGRESICFLKFGVTSKDDPSGRIAAHRKHNPLGFNVDMQCLVHFRADSEIEVFSIEREAKRFITDVGLCGFRYMSKSGEWLNPDFRQGAAETILSVLAASAVKALPQADAHRKWVRSIVDAHAVVADEYVMAMGPGCEFDVDCAFEKGRRSGALKRIGVHVITGGDA